MRAAIWEQPGELRINERSDPTPGEGELVIKVGACGDGVKVQVLPGR
jgi:D-arabinose 1-dehydrogenase-like Zn-dependent alcohol dehydrogenase